MGQRGERWGSKWGLEIVGLREKPVQRNTSSSDTGAVNNPSGLIQRKRLAENVVVNTLGAGLVRKKAKTADDDDASTSRQQAAQPQVNVLSGGLVRKKPKPAETKETEA